MNAPAVDKGIINALDGALLDGDLVQAALPVIRHYTNTDDALVNAGVALAAGDIKGSFRRAATTLQEAGREYLREKTGNNFPNTRGKTPTRDRLRTAIRPMTHGELRAQVRADCWNIFAHARREREQFKLGFDVIIDPTELGHFGQFMQQYRGFKDGVRQFEELQKACTTGVARAATPIVNRNNEVGSPVGSTMHTTWLRSVGTANLFCADTYRAGTSKFPSKLMEASLVAARPFGRIRFRIADRYFRDHQTVQVVQEDCKKNGGGYILRVPEQKPLGPTWNWKNAPKMGYTQYSRSLSFLTAWHWLKGDFKKVETKEHMAGQEGHFSFTTKVEVAADTGVFSDLLIYVAAKKDTHGEWTLDWNGNGAIMWFWVDHAVKANRAGLYRHAYLNRMGGETGFRNEKQNFSTTQSWTPETRDAMWAIGVLMAGIWSFLRVHQRALFALGFHIPETEVLDLSRFCIRFTTQASSLAHID